MKIVQNKPLLTISRAINEYVDFISSTYGPAGKKILIALSDYNTKAIDDGYEASKEYELENEFYNAVISYIKESTRKTNTRVGDGTTTAAILTGAIYNEVTGDLTDPMNTNRNYHGKVVEIQSAIKEAIQQIKDKSKKVKTKQELYKIAYNSYNNEEIATLISDTLFKIGQDGMLVIEDSNSTVTHVEMVKGLEIDKGFVSPYLITNIDTEEVILHEPRVIIINKRLEVFDEIVGIIQKIVAEGKKEIMIVAEGFGDSLLNAIIMLKMKGICFPLLVEASGFGENRLESLRDIAAVTGSKVIDPKIIKIENLTPDYLGIAKKVTSKKDKTVIIGENDKEIPQRVKSIEKTLEITTNTFEKEKLQKRIASLKGGIALIRVGANTENEQQAIKAKVEDSVNATKVAFKDGIVKGAGKTYAEIKTSSIILNNALKVPQNKLKENGEEYLDENVTDPTGVLIAALETGGSIACGLLEIGGIITVKRKKEDTSNTMDF